MKNHYIVSILIFLTPMVVEATNQNSELSKLASALEQLDQQIPQIEEEIVEKKHEEEPQPEDISQLNQKQEDDALIVQANIQNLTAENSEIFVQNFVKAAPKVQEKAMEVVSDEDAFKILQKTVKKNPDNITKLIKNDKTGKINKPAPITKLLVQLAIENDKTTMETVADTIKPFFQKPIEKQELLHALLDEITLNKGAVNKKNQPYFITLFDKLTSKMDPYLFDEKYQGKGKSIRERLEELKPSVTTTDTFIQDLISKLPPPKTTSIKPILKKPTQKIPLQEGFVKEQIKFYEDYYLNTIANNTAPSLANAKQKFVFIKKLHETVKDKIWPIKNQDRKTAQETLTFLFKNKGTLPKDKPFVPAAIRLIGRIDLDLVPPAVEFNKEFYKGSGKTVAERSYDFMDEMLGWAIQIVEYYLEDIMSGALNSKSDDRVADLSRAIRYLHQIWPYFEEALLEAERGDEASNEFINKLREKIELFRKLLIENKHVFKKLDIDNSFLIIGLDSIIREKNRVFCVSGWKVVTKNVTNLMDILGNVISGPARTYNTVEERIPHLILVREAGPSATGLESFQTIVTVSGAITTGTLPTPLVERIEKENTLYYQSFRIDLDCALALIKAIPQEKDETNKIIMQKQVINAINKFVGYALDKTGLVCPSCLTNNLQGRWIFGQADRLTDDDLNTIKFFLSTLDKENRFVKKALIGVEILRKIAAYIIDILSTTSPQLLVTNYQNLLKKLTINYDEFGLTGSEIISWLDPDADKWRSL